MDTLDSLSHGLGGVIVKIISSIVWRRRRPNDEIVSAAAAKREKRIGGNKRLLPWANLERSELMRPLDLLFILF